jgi:hypothetical protein
MWLKKTFSIFNIVLLAGALIISGANFVNYAMAAQDSGSVGLEGKISAPPPSQGATITLPRDGAAFTTIPIDVVGICPTGLLVKLFKNNVFAGSQQCTNGSFSIKIDLFTGTNELIARVYDALDQAGPDSNKVTVSFNDNRQGAGSRVTLTSNFAKRGTNPGATLTWPIIISGGTGPYAISVDWGDGKAPDLKSIQNPGTFDIEHIYDSPGVYNIIIKGTDKNGDSAFLQLVGIANGALSQDSGDQGADGAGGVGATRTRIIWQPSAIAIPLIISTFWLGKRYELKVLRRKIERGERPF